jgi:hypothetical protein
MGTKGSYWLMSEVNLNGLSRDELTDLLSKVMICLRKFEAEEIKSDFITITKRLRLELQAREESRKNHGQKKSTGCTPP